MRKTYKNDGIMKALTIIGGILAIVAIILRLLRAGDVYPSPYPYWNIYEELIVATIAGLIGAVLTLLCALRPGDPIPFNWIFLLIFAIWLIIFADILGGVLVLIAFLIGLIEDL